MPARSPRENAPRRARDPLAGLRRLLLILGIGALLGIGLLLAAYRFGKAPDSGSTPTAEATDDDFVGKNFDYTQTSDGVPVFRIRAEKSRQNRDDTAFLERVVLDIFRANGQVYTVTSDRATWSEGSWQAELEGDVVLRGIGDLVLRSRALGLAQEGRRLESRGEVRFEWGEDYVGRASDLVVDRESDALSLGGGVHLRSADESVSGLRLDSRRLVYERGAGVLRAIGDAHVERGREAVSARQITLFLIEGTQEVESLRASWEVEGRLRAGWTEIGLSGQASAGSEVHSVFDPAADFRFSGDHLEIDVLDTEAAPEEAPRRILLESDVGSADLRIVEEGGLEKHLIAQRLEARLRGREILWVDGNGQPLTVSERLVHAPEHVLQQACARKGRALFLPDGSLGRIELEEQVELREPSRTVTGARKVILGAQDGRLLIEGVAAELHDAQGTVTAPRFTWKRDSDLLRADGGVQTTLVDSSLTELTTGVLGNQRGPVRVVSDEALWTTAPATFSFRGNVRAWRAESLLLADQLRGGETSGEIAAGGGVKTIWVPGASATAEAVPIEVTAEGMTYRRDSSEVVYEGGEVEARQGGRRVLSSKMTLYLDASGRLDRMEFEGDVRINDPEAGRRVQGDHAVYTLADGSIEVRGTPVILVDGEGNRLEGRYLMYDTLANRVQLSSRLPEAGP